MSPTAGTGHAASSANEDAGLLQEAHCDQEQKEAAIRAVESAFHMTGVVQILEYYGFH